MTGALVLAITLAASPSHSAPATGSGEVRSAQERARPLGPTVAVRILSHFRPVTAEIQSPLACHLIAVEHGALLLDGKPTPTPISLPEARWRVAVPGAYPRRYLAALSVTVEEGRLAVVARIPLEEYVANAAASETTPDTPFEALAAQAVVARSYALAAGNRHGDADLCDLAHCQVIGAAVPNAHREAARAAARITAGQVLRLPAGEIAQTVFHASCGGHTADPVELFGGQGTGATAVEDPDCLVNPWIAEVPQAAMERTIRTALSINTTRPAPHLADLGLRYGQGGFLVQVVFGDRRVAGETFARSIDAALGYGVVRSSRFEASERSDGVIILKGTGIGHGAGLCQAGASLRASRGEGYASILRHYFPATKLDVIRCGK